MLEINSKSDEELVVICLSEDKDIFGVLIDRYEDKLSRYIRRISQLRAEDTEDVLQVIFLKAWQNLWSFKPDLKFSSWIYRIAHNETLTYIRHGRNRVHSHTINIDDSILENIASEVDVLQEIGKRHDSETLKEILLKLPQDQYDVIMLKFFEEKSYDEISDILMIPTGTVATRINRAKLKIREIINNSKYNYE